MATKFNKILNKARVGTVKRNGQDVAVAVATRTQTWFRPSDMIERQGPRFLTALESDPDQIAPGTKEVVLREAEHSSEEDPKEHFSGVQLKKVAPDDNIPEDGKTGHFYKKK